MPYRELSPDLQKKAEKELNEIPARIPADLKHIRDWLEKQTHLCARTDDQWLLGFLRGCKFSLQQTKEKLEQFYTMRTLIPEFFSNRDPLSPEIQKILKTNLIFPLPKSVDPTGPRIILIRWKEANPETMPIINLYKIFFMTMDVLMNEDDTCMVGGVLFFIDNKDYSFKYTMQLNPTIAKKFVFSMQRNYPIRLKGFHSIYTPSVIEVLYNIIKLLLPEKLVKRNHIYSEVNSGNVYKVIPKSIFPKEYGGDMGSADELGAAWRKKLESYREWFLEDANYCSNEALRPGNPKTCADVFDMEGSCRKLEID